MVVIYDKKFSISYKILPEIRIQIQYKILHYKRQNTPFSTAKFL